MEVILFLFGLIIGSFLNVLIYRVPRGESVVFPPSHCPVCNHRLGVGDLLPLLSFLFLKGHCRYCGIKINPRYPLVELLSGLVTLLWSSRFGFTVAGGMFLLFSYGVLVIAFIDWEWQLIPNWFTLPLLIVGLLFGWYQGRLGEALIGGLIGGGVLGLIAVCYPKGMGMGDVKYLAMAGTFLGWLKVLTVLFGGSVLGLLVMVPLMGWKRFDHHNPFPFGPFLAAATLIVIYGWEGIQWLFCRTGLSL